MPGIYTIEERAQKIISYKKKIKKWREDHPVNRVFNGRSRIAVKKPRIKGKFVTDEEYATHFTENKEINFSSAKQEE